MFFFFTFEKYKYKIGTIKYDSKSIRWRLFSLSSDIHIYKFFFPSSRLCISNDSRRIEEQYSSASSYSSSLIFLLCCSETLPITTSSFDDSVALPSPSGLRFAASFQRMLASFHPGFTFPSTLTTLFAFQPSLWRVRRVRRELFGKIFEI